jgi:hypothetical protein
MKLITTEMVAIKKVVEPEIKREAEDRRKSTQIQGGKPPNGSAKLAGPKGESRDIVAKYVGVSHETLEKMEEVVDH